MTCFRRIGRCPVCRQWVSVTRACLTLVGHSTPSTRTTCPGSYHVAADVKAVAR